MRTSLPAPGELPMHRHQQIRAELVRTVERDSRRGRSRWLLAAVLATAATAAVALVVSVITWPVGGHDRTAGGPAGTALDALSAEEREEIERGCAADARKRADDTHPGLLVTDPKLVNLVDDELGTYALLLQKDPDVFVGCTVHEPGSPAYEGLGKYSTSYWRLGSPDGPMTLDFTTISPAQGKDKVEVSIDGRVSDAIADVTYTTAGGTWRASVDNHTFVLRAQHDREPGGRAILRAYDADGNLLDTSELDYDRYIRDSG